MRKIFIGAAAVIMTSSIGAMAGDEAWTVARVSQPSRYTEDGRSWRMVEPGMTIRDTAWISTGPRGRVVLQRNRDRVTFQPGTLAGLFEKAGQAVHTDFAQQTGTLSLEIDPRVKPHLSVQTPYLAAVVKGTIFSVSVTAGGATVGVDRGRVEVTDATSGERTGVHAGQKAAVDRDPATAMALSGINKDFEAVVRVRPFAPVVAPAASLAAPAPTALSAKASSVAAKSGAAKGKAGAGTFGAASGAGEGPAASGGRTGGKSTGSDAASNGSVGNGSDSAGRSDGGSGASGAPGASGDDRSGSGSGKYDGRDNGTNGRGGD